MLSVLFITSEAYPLVKTGGLADVSGSLPAALQALDHPVRVLLPAYRSVRDVAAAAGMRELARLTVNGEAVRLVETQLPDSGVPVWLVDCPSYFDRPGNPYHDADGEPWPDNAERFGLLCRVAAEIACDRAGLGWRPDIVHCNDWQSGLVPALLLRENERPTSVFTIHNLAYQGVFDYEAFGTTGLPSSFFSPDGLEFHGGMSFIKGGIVYADRVTTVSPNYAREIQTKAFGHGLDGLLRHRSDRLSGILNGIDSRVWNPAGDPNLAQPYSSRDLDRKRVNKGRLQLALGLEPTDEMPLVGFIGRLVEQKGIDLLLEVLPDLLAAPAQMAVLGSGLADYERSLRAMAADHSDRLSVTLGYDEPLAHQIEAGADIFAMPSRFEPCGLNQMYSLRYGTVPVVHATGGLADTVVDTGAESLADGSANGFTFTEPSAAKLADALQRTIDAWHDRPLWRRLQHNGMRRDFSWHRSALAYQELYQEAHIERHYKPRE